MTRIAILSLLLAMPAFAVEPDPERLKPTADQLREAEALVTKLGSDIYRERDAATAKLVDMGRIALPAVVKALAETANAEVRERCEALRPKMQAAEVQARLDAFMADTEGKFDHKLPGWEKFHAIVGKTAASRKLYGEMYAHAPTARLLMISTGPKEDFSKAVLDRRAEIYNRMYGRQRFIAGNGVVVSERHPPLPAEVAGILFTESLLGSHTNSSRTGYSINSIILQAGMREILGDEKTGEPHRKLVAAWCDTRTDGYEMYLAMTMATSLTLNNPIKELSPAKYALKVLEAKQLTPLYYGYAIGTLAKGGKEQLPNIVKQFDNKTVIPTAFFAGANGVSQRVEIQIRDMALAMALVVTEQKPEDYGFLVTGRGVTEANKYTYNSYRLESDEKRDAAFKKWDEAAKKK